MHSYDRLRTEAGQQRACVRFAAHDVRNEFDDPSDVARMFGVRAVPSFIFFVGGAKVRWAAALSCA